MTPYIIKPGDTLYLIALRFGVKVDQIMQANPNVDPYSLRVGQVICIPSKWNIYFNQKLNVTFRAPSTWRKIETGPYEPIRYEGKDGFFEVTAIATNPKKPWDVPPIEEVCKSYAFGKFNPYGTNPTIERISIKDQQACYILPSKDQSEDFNNSAALIVRYPKVIFISGNPHAYLILYADKDYIKAIGSTLSFFNKDTKLTKEEAEILVSAYLVLYNNPNVKVEYDHMEGERYVIHVYEIVDNHTSTRGWYYVNPKTAKIESMF